MKPLICIRSKGYPVTTRNLRFCWRNGCGTLLDTEDDTLGLCPRCIEDLRRSS